MFFNFVLSGLIGPMSGVPSFGFLPTVYTPIVDFHVSTPTSGKLTSRNSPCAREIRQVEYHALRESHLCPRVVLRPMRQAAYQRCPEKIWKVLSVDAAWFLQIEKY